MVHPSHESLFSARVAVEGFSKPKQLIIRVNQEAVNSGLTSEKMQSLLPSIIDKMRASEGGSFDPDQVSDITISNYNKALDQVDIQPLKSKQLSV